MSKWTNCKSLLLQRFRSIQYLITFQLHTNTCWLIWSPNSSCKRSIFWLLFSWILLGQIQISQSTSNRFQWCISTHIKTTQLDTYVSIQTTFKFTFYISHLSGVHRDIRFGPTVCTLSFHHSMCLSPEVQCCDCCLNDDKEWRILILRCTF